MSGFLCPHCQQVRHVRNIWDDDGGYDSAQDHCWYCGTLVDAPEKRVDLDALKETGDVVISRWSA